MKKIVFKNVYLLSPKERSAKAITLHPQKNLILGANHTGKSSLIKNIYITLGATPNGKLDKWDTGTISLVSFTIQEKEYKVLLHAGHRALFDINNKLIFITADAREWADKFCEITGFNLLVTKRKDAETVLGNAACFFLPFYIDQDSSWNAKWDTFGAIQQFSSPQKSILEYFAGIKPSEWYRLESERKIAVQKENEIKQEIKHLDRAKERVKKSLPQNGPKIDSANFDYEIALLTQEINTLNNQQQVLRGDAVQEKELINTLENQIDISLGILSDYNKDYEYLKRKNREFLVCPTCNSEHKEAFIDLFEYVEDARILEGLLYSLENDLAKTKNRYQEKQEKIQALEIHYRKIDSILKTQKDELEFDDVISCLSAEKALTAFKVEHEDLQKDLNEALGIIDGLKTKLNELTSRKRTNEINTTFKSKYAIGLQELKLPPIEMKGKNISSRPDLSGSGGPRHVLAYYYALWETMKEFGDFMPPITVDTPNQQGQDAVNLKAIMLFISNKLLAEAQIIIGSEVNPDTKFNNTIELKHEYSLMQKSEYNDVNAIIEPLTKAMLIGLNNKADY